MKIQIKITKDILKRSMMCGIAEGLLSKNCAFAVAIIDIAPFASVGCDEIIWDKECIFRSYLPIPMQTFIKQFDKATPSYRINVIPEQSFEIDFPDEMVEQIGIEQITEILSKSETLSMA